jgi:hypothetical protein
MLKFPIGWATLWFGVANRKTRTPMIIVASRFMNPPGWGFKKDYGEGIKMDGEKFVRCLNSTLTRREAPGEG